MQLREVMTPNPYGVQMHESVQHTAELMRRHGVGALVVYEQDRAAGVITDRDITVECVAAGHRANECPTVEHITADPVMISADAEVGDALRMMGDEQVRRLLVTNGGSVAGIVALGDLAARFPDHPELARALSRISQPIRLTAPAMS